MGVAYWINDYSYALALVKIGFLGVMFIPIGTYSFSVYYAEEKNQKIIIYLGLILTLIIALLIHHPLFTQGLYSYPWGYYIKLGPLSYVTLGLFIIFVPLFIRNFYLKYKRASKEYKRWSFFALIAGGIAFFASIDFLPAYGISSNLPLGFVFIGCFVTLMGYYILRHHLSDIKIILGRSMGYFILTFFLYLIYLSIFLLLFPKNNPLLHLMNGLFFLIGLYTLTSIKEKSQHIIEELFFREKIDFQNLVNQFNRGLRNLADLATLLNSLFALIKDRLQIETAKVMLFDPRGMQWTIYELQNHNEIKKSIANADIQKSFLEYFIKHPNTLYVHNLVYINAPKIILQKIHKLFFDHKSNVALPLTRHSNFFGFILIGKKYSQKGYTQKDLRALNCLSAPFAIALDNARLYENMQNSSKLKSDFVSVASHQLRTPLTSLKWALKTLSNQELGALTSEQKDLINTMYGSTDNMIQIVNQWLDIARLEEDSAKTSFQAISLTHLIENVTRDFEMQIKEKQISFKKHIPKNLPSVLANEEFTKTALAILIDNAIRYTKAGGTICSTVKRAEKKQNVVLVSIKDSGIGIPKDQQGQIFTKFFRANNAVSIQPNGSGLGLFYAKIIIEKQGGNIWFRSKENTGTTFYFTLPFAKKG